MSGTPSRFSRMVGVAAASVIALGTLAGCAGGGAGSPGIVADDSWTVMTYMIADTNLEYYQMSDMEEQASVGSRPGFNLISYLDRSAEEYEGPVIGLPDWSGAKTLKITKGGADVLEDHGKVDTGDPAILSGFITDTIKAYPAGHYALIFNDHGSSWPGVGADGSADNDQLTLAELKSGISKGLKDAGVPKLDMVGFDACLMASYETASTLQGVADRMVASEELEPGYGWDYSSLEAAAQGGTVDDLASSIIDAYDKQSQSEGEAQVTLAELDLTKMKALDKTVTAFAGALTDRVDGIAPTVGRTLADNLGFGATPDYNFYMTDLGMLAGQISVDATDVADEADALTKALNKVVIDKVDGQATKGATGLSIYFAPQERLYSKDYDDVTAAAAWTKFLKTYYTTGQESGSVPTFASAQAQSKYDADQGGFLIAQQITSDPSQITDVYVRYGQVEADGSVTLVGDEPAQITEDGVAVGFFDTYELWIGDGTTEDHFYSSYSLNRDSGVATIGVPVAYFLTPGGKGTQAFLQMTYQPSTGTILSETFYGYDPDAGAFSELAPAAGSTVAPLKPKLDGSGEGLYLTSDLRLNADPDALSFEYRALPSGTQLYAELNIEDSAGNKATSAAVGVKP